MPPADSAYHIKLNGHGFILVDGSYIEKSQQAFNPRFSTGDPNLGDLSFWQFIAQEDWTGGEGQVKFTDTAKYAKSSGWYMGGLRPRLTGGSAVFTPTSAANKLANYWHKHCQFLRFGRTGDQKNRLVLCGFSVSNSADAVHSVLQAAGASQIGIDQVRTDPASVWQRQAMTAAEGGARFLCAANTLGTPPFKLEFYDTTWTSRLSHTLTSLAKVFCLVPITVDKLLVIGHGLKSAGATDANLYFGLLTLTNNAWTVSAYVESYAGEFPSWIGPRYGIDANGSIYFAGAEYCELTSDHTNSCLGVMTAADAVLTGGPRLSEILNYPDFFISGIVTINGVIHLIGMRLYRKSGTTLTKYQVLQYPDTVIWESASTPATVSFPLGSIKAISQESRQEAYFIVPSVYGDGDLIMRLDATGVFEVGNLPHVIPAATTNGETAWMGVARSGSSFYAYDSEGNRFVKSQQDLSVPLSGLTKRVLELSAFGCNTPLIQKTAYAVIVDLTQVLPANSTITIKVNEVSIGTMTSADGLVKEIQVPSGTEISASAFTIKLEMPANATWEGELNRCSLRFVPTQFKKLAWGLALRCDMNQQLLNGQRESRTAEGVFKDIKNAWVANQPIDYEDVDGSVHRVLVTEYSRRRPLVATNPKRRESIVALEILEV